MSSRPKVLLWISSIVFMLVLAACVPPPAVQPPRPQADEQPELPDPPANEPPDSSTDSEMAVPEGMELGDCPSTTAILFLKFSADIRIVQGDVVFEHNLQDGVLSLNVPEGNPSTATLVGQGGVDIPVKISGKMGDCTLQGSSSMSPSASGSCQNGIVYLTIQENWKPGQGTLTCPDDDEPAPFQIPAVGQMTHSGPGGRGEVFYMDMNYSTTSVGSMVEKPFQGGQGVHTWTLLWDYTFIPTFPPE